MKIRRNDILHFHRVEEALPFIIHWPSNPKVLTLHGVPYKGIKQRNNAFVSFIYKLIERLVISKVDRVIAVSDEGRQYLLSQYGKESTVIPVGVDVDKFVSRDKSRGKVVLFVGRFEAEKGIGDLVRASRNIDATFVAVGSGPLKKILLANGIKVLGKVPHDKMPEVYSSADVLVLPSSYEGFPTVVLEALACGVPVVSYDVGDVSEVLDVSVGKISSPTDFVRDVAEVLENGRLKTKCRARAMEYSWKKVARKIIAIYGKLFE